ncbi:MAG: N-acetylmuramoyl-L-alanine amidase [Campylobacter sp.]|nr:N-acetylmuramoyl-L-alanine amidase [Campylobacter sp.]
MRNILAFFALSLCLFANPVLDKFDKNFNSATRTGKLSLHNEVKKLYVSTLIKNNTDLKKQSLQRLVKSSKALGLNSSQYEADLRKLNSKTSKSNIANNKNSKIANYQKAQTSDTYLLSASKGNNALNLKFNKSISQKDFKIHSLYKNKIYRNMIDIKATLNGKSITYKNFLANEVRVYPLDKQTTRITFISPNQQNLNIKILDSYLVISTSKFLNKEVLVKGLKKQNTQQKYKDFNEEAVQTDTQNFAPAPRASSAKTIVIDPGHGGNDPGAVNGRLKEKIVVMDIATKLSKELKKRGHRVYFTRNKDKFINLRTRTKFANDKMADIFISIHANAAPNKSKARSMHGIETFFLSPARSERSKNAAALENKSDIDEMNYFSKQTFLNFLNREKIIASNKLAIDIQRESLLALRKRYSGVSDGGVREAPFWVLVGALMPAVLVEVGYITHPSEGPRLYENTYQDSIAKGIANGLDDYFRNNP